MRVLVLAPHYHTFIKGITDAAALALGDSVIVAVKYNPLAEISSVWSKGSGCLEWLRRYTKARLVNTEGTPHQVHIMEVPIHYLIPDSKNVTLGDRLFRKVDRLVREQSLEFDVIHAHVVLPCGYAGMKMKERYRIPLVVTAHGSDIYRASEASIAKREQTISVLNSADCIVTVSTRNEQCVRDFHRDARVSVIPNGFDKDLFTPMNRAECRERLGISGDRVLVSVGALEKVKGHEFLIEALRRVLDTRGNVVCYFVGDGRRRSHLESMVSELHLGKNVQFIGHVPHKNVPIWLNAADVSVLPSLDEGNPTAMFESLGCGTPLVASIVGGIPDILTSEDLGLLVRPGDSDDLSDKLHTALEKKWNRQSIREFSLRFSWGEVAERTIAVYRDIVGRENV